MFLAAVSRRQFVSHNELDGGKTGCHSVIHNQQDVTVLQSLQEI